MTNPFLMGIGIAVIIPAVFLIVRDILGLVVPLAFAIIAFDSVSTIFSDPEEKEEFSKTFIKRGGISHVLDLVKGQLLHFLGPNIGGAIGYDIFTEIAKYWYIHLPLQMLIIPLLALGLEIIPVVILFYSLAMVFYMNENWMKISDSKTIYFSFIYNGLVLVIISILVFFGLDMA
jgi:hypothetical protein